jgi:hypothetical protein
MDEQLAHAASGPAGPSLWTILTEAMGRPPVETKRTVALGIVAWLGLLALQAYDSAD